MECSLRKLFQLLRSEGFFLSSSFHTSAEVFSYLCVLGKCRKITNISYVERITMYVSQNTRKMLNIKKYKDV